MAFIKTPIGCKSRPGIDQVLRYPIDTRRFDLAVKEYYDLLKIDREMRIRDPAMYRYVVERCELRKEVNPIEDSEGYPESKLYKVLNDSYLKYRMQIQLKAIEEFVLLHAVKEQYIKMTKGPLKTNNDTTTSQEGSRRHLEHSTQMAIKGKSSIPTYNQDQKPTPRHTQDPKPTPRHTQDPKSTPRHTQDQKSTPRHNNDHMDTARHTQNQQPPLRHYDEQKPTPRYHEGTRSTQRDTHNSPIKINGVIYYPQPASPDSDSRMSLQSELIARLQKEVYDCNTVIDDLRDRLNKSANRDVKEGGPNVIYTDKHTPTKLAEDFRRIFTVEWSDAMKSLTYNKQDENTEEETISLLMNIIENGYEFCSQNQEMQLQKLSFSVERGLEDPFATILDLRNTKYDQRKRVPDSLMKELKHLRKVENLQIVLKAVQKFKEGELLRNPQYNYRHLPAVEGFVDAVIETLWLMAIQEPPMVIAWPQPNDRFNESIYKPYKKQGSVVKQAVWPAVFLHQKGPLMEKGYAKPI